MMSSPQEDLGEECSSQRGLQMSTHGARTEVRVHEMEGQPVCLVAGVGEDKRLRYQQSQVCENRHMQLGGGAGLG